MQKIIALNTKHKTFRKTATNRDIELALLDKKIEEIEAEITAHLASIERSCVHTFIVRLKRKIGQLRFQIEELKENKISLSSKSGPMRLAQ